VTLFRRPLAAVLGLALPLLVAAPGGALAAKTSHHVVHHHVVHRHVVHHRVRHVVRHRVVRHRVTHHSVAKTKG
jgi:hypothetical protein